MNKFNPIDLVAGGVAVKPPIGNTLLPPSKSPAMGLVLAMLVACLTTAFADQAVNLSVKVIRATDGTRPSGGLADVAGFAADVTYGNVVLTNTGRGYRLVVVEFVDIQPPVPVGQPGNYWFSLDVLSTANKDKLDLAAEADKVTWKWNDKAINVYVNDAAGGQCSQGPAGTIFLGKTQPSPGTVIHEIGHSFTLRHTHDSDFDGVVGRWEDGDLLSETLPDDPDASLADINARYASFPQQIRDNLYYNVMSYHVESRLLPTQMNKWDSAAPGANSLSRRNWYVANGGNDANAGDTAAVPFATLARALTAAATSFRAPSDIITLQAVTYPAPAGNRFDTPCALKSAGGTVRIVRQ